MGIRISEMEEATTFGADDYVPIVTNGANKKALGQKIKDFIAGFFVSKSGDTMSDDLTIEKRSGNFYLKTPNMTVDTSANNGLSQSSWCNFASTDSNGYMYAWAESGATTTGSNSINIGCRNKDTNGNEITNSIQLHVYKNGTTQVSIDHKEEFRKGLGANGIVYEWYNKSNLGTLVSNTDYTVTFDVSKTGYTPIGIVQFRLQGSYSTWFHASQWNISGNTATVIIRSDASGVSSTNMNVGIGVIYANTVL